MNAEATPDKAEELFGPRRPDEEPAAAQAEAAGPDDAGTVEVVEDEADAAAKAAEADAAEDAADGDDAAAPGSIPAHVLAAARRDWKAQAIRLEEQAKAAQAERDRLAKELEEARKAPPPAAPQPQHQPAQLFGRRPLDRAADPVGAAISDKLDVFEDALRERHGDAEVDARMAEFEAEAARNPVLVAGVMSARNPYRAMFDAVGRLRAAREIGDDPAAYRERVRAEERARIEAEMAGARVAPVLAAPVAPRAAPQVPARAPSLAGVRSAAPRVVDNYAGPPAWEDILPNGQHV